MLAAGDRGGQLLARSHDPTVRQSSRRSEKDRHVGPGCEGRCSRPIRVALVAALAHHLDVERANRFGLAARHPHVAATRAWPVRRARWVLARR